MEQIVVRGIAERLLFEAPDSDYRVFRLHDEADDATYTVTGHGTKPLVGDRLEIKGHWVQHKRYGRQFAADGWSRIIPESVDGIERFLGSGAVKGLGPALAHRVVAAFGKDTMKILERDPQRLLEVEGIGPKKLAVITESFYEEKQVNDIAYDLEQHGVAGRYAGRLLQKYGDDVHYVLTEEPYRMIAEIDGIGFKTADQMALAYGMDRQDPQRLSAGLTYVLQTMTQNGHVCIPDAELVRRAAFILQADALGLHDILKEAIEVGQLCTADFQGTVYVYTPEAYEEENYIARRIQDMAAMKPLPMKTHVQLFLDRWQDSCHFELADKQREAVEKSLESGMTVITGGPGTGKTTVVQTIIRLAEQEGLRILLCAPTGRAAKRLAETTQRKAKTIHRLLIPDGRQGRIQVFEYNETKLLPADLVIVDEVSMLDMEMMYHLLSALKPQCRCILVGDADQLPSVGAGAVLHDIIASGQVPVVRLDTIFRQQEGGRIVTNAHLINSGRLPVVNEDPEFRFVEIEDEAQGAEKISALYNSELLETGDKFAVQVLSPMYKNPCGVDNLNQLIQGRFNPPAEEKGELKGKNVIFRVGDKVMQKHNDYEKGVFNGDIGEIFAIQKDMVYVRYPEQDVKYEGQEVDEITLAYAITVHKSQGSEYHTVIMVLVNSHAIMLQRNLFYTAVTRAKRKVILVGSKRAVQTAVQNQRTSRRFTLLIPRLQGELIV
ncbi:MAG: ATP-dependent RecD-like DNA helicase [Megasphaera elsdenii]|jgi:exodeoxyribonuclease V alpha subunit|uniref:SF1B family DNA helicase RecD2 n=2 Tax=Megasphaera elsdenii TaxID=907 RepID=UPI00070596D3|nr:ATP-dependent RecD-like DNA helicase [Megasphaera elsdenii]ALG42808.1 helicase RecD [Megasphaera elsdenii 14-14]MCI5658904.1 ATP-dependent RecD-like DNA helicase [Megasphaera elsdenii]MCI6301418.1 ATP-dependent RecD-like DNA helicase [Megasphaera elsdenii]MCI7111754.1 ATP-dependent RecD-like DNA helicase [Megasphaera elsdenii]MCI7201252.1 ATP-dependent RecD-like DNA helicase [Megasphaera elsdenii]